MRPNFMSTRYNKVITEPLAKMGFTNAQYKMGVFWLSTGIIEPTEEEIERAVYWWEKAAAKGHKKATQELGWLLNGKFSDDENE